MEATESPIVGAAPTPAPRRPWAAVLFSLLTPGLGHLYACAPKRAALVWAAAQAGGLLLVLGIFVVPPRVQIPVLLLAALAGVVAIAWDSARTARRRDPALPLPRYANWLVYVTVILVGAFLWQPREQRWIKANVAEAFRIPSVSMAPTVFAGDWLWTVPDRGPVSRGDLVVYRAADSAMMLKRVVAVPGDTIEMRDRQLFVNGHAVPEPYAHWTQPADSTTAYDSLFDWQRTILASRADRASYHPTLRTWGPLAIPAGAYFVLGDNRDQSLDSRYAGLVQRPQITRRPTVIYFSWDSDWQEVRWDRVGKVVR